MDNLIKYSILGFFGLLLFAAVLPVVGPIIWVIIINPVFLGLTVFCGLIYLIYKMKREDNN